MGQIFLTTFAYAKINLALAIIGIRNDGYHEVQSVMQSIDLHDIVKVRRYGEKVVCRCGELSGSENLAYKAADLFLKQCRRSEGIEIEIEKHIPVQAGLAGGSSDAAAVLRLLNQLYGKLLGEAELLKLSEQCGADVAFCLRGGTMWATGRGEKLELLPPAPEMDIVIAKPSAGVNTKEAYRRFDRLGRVKRLIKADWERALSQASKPEIIKLFYNDLEPASIQMVPKILKLKQLLAEEKCYGSLMCGSGSSVFGIAQGKQHAVQIVERLQKKGYKNVWTAKTVARLKE